jgi:predicted lactoylglutathione lyase/uncharacterized protein YndB with AHSA1/START domain
MGKPVQPVGQNISNNKKPGKMTKELLFNFTADKAAKKIFITREFDAGLSLVWDAFTTQKILDQWTAPAPYLARTKYMNFEVGGKRFYAMVSPEGQERWIIQKYTSITPKANFKLHNAFADEHENPELPGSEWDYSFSEQNGVTTANITIYNESFERMEKLADGFKEGFSRALENLDGFFAQKKIAKNRTILVNLPVKDLQKSMGFYSALGFENYPHISDETAKYMVWSEHISVLIMTQEKFISLVPKPLADTRQTMAGFYTLSVSSLEELNSVMTNGINAGGKEPNEMDDYGFMLQRTIEDLDGHCWNLLFIDKTKITTAQ